MFNMSGSLYFFIPNEQHHTISALQNEFPCFATVIKLCNWFSIPTCSGVLVSRSIVLTAAHCVVGCDKFKVRFVMHLWLNIYSEYIE